MPNEIKIKASKAFVAIKRNNSNELSQEKFILHLRGKKELYSSLEEGSWVLLVSENATALAVARVYRVRSTLRETTLYFDRYQAAIENVGVELPTTGLVAKREWTSFAEALTKYIGVSLADISHIKDLPNNEAEVYVRELLQHAVTDDLLGPANGPHENIFDMSVRDRYMFGRLAPVDAQKNSGGAGVDGSSDENADDELVVKTAPEKKTKEKDGIVSSGEKETNEEVDTADNQSIIPSSVGFTFCVAGDVSDIEISANWGRYERFYEHEKYKVIKDPETGEEKQGQKMKVWQRIPCGGKHTLPLITGLIQALSIDGDNPEVKIKGMVREPNENGDRLVTLFLVNTRVEPETNKDTAWVFQPEVQVCATEADSHAAIFRRRPVLKATGEDLEREALEMIYRKQVEFAVGHGIAVHATVADDDRELATSINTVIIPEYEVPVTEVPGLKEHDRPALKKMVTENYLDMSNLATMSKDDLVAALTVMTTDYSAWIEEQRCRIGETVIGHDDTAKRALHSCTSINVRLKEGIQCLASNENALEAFRFANKAMANQRIRSIYAGKRRLNKELTLEELDIPQNRSWRSFQLAFLLLSIPGLAEPEHKDRTDPAEAFADLLWFPTGGGKTEAYLGVAAFTMAIRRFQGNLGGYDSSRGLAVVMRYTLRLLTLQQFQRATTLICAMEMIRRDESAAGDKRLGEHPFTIGLWVGNRVTPGTTEASHIAIEAARDKGRNQASNASPAQLTSCPWCGSEIAPGRDIRVNKEKLQTSIFCGDKRGRCDFSQGKSANQPHPGIPALMVDEEIYHRPPSMMIATVDKFAMMAWRGETRTLFGNATTECDRHGLLWPDAKCTGTHQKSKALPATKAKKISRIRPPDLIIQDEFHLISGPLGTMVGLYETAVDELCTWSLNGKGVKPKIIAATATVRKAKEQINGVFMRKVSIFPPHGLDIEDNFFSVQRPIAENFGRRYLGLCSPGSARPAVLIRVYTALLTASQDLFNRFGQAADPYMTAVGYFNSLRELGGMKRLAEDDVQTRSYRVAMSAVDRPGLAQRSVNNIKELTSRVSSQDIPKYLDQLEVKFKYDHFDTTEGKYVTRWQEGEARAIDVVLATNMLSVGVDVNRLGVMAVNGQPKSTAEYIQATSRVGRSFPGLVCTVLTWARPRDLSHYETFEHYHATFYKHVEAQSVTPFSPRALDRGLTGAMISMMRLENDVLNANDGARELKVPSDAMAEQAVQKVMKRASMVAGPQHVNHAEDSVRERIDHWVTESRDTRRDIAYEKRGEKVDQKVALMKSPGGDSWDKFTVPMSMREVEPGVKLQMNIEMLQEGPDWQPRVDKDKESS